MAIIKKSLLFTVHTVDNKITCVRCNLTGKFVKRNTYFAIEKETTTEYGSFTDFNVVSLSDDYINVLDVLFLALFSVLSVSLINLFFIEVNMKHLSIIIMFLIIAIAYTLCYSTIKERQAQYNNLNNSNELLSNYYTECSTDSECEQLEAQLNFDFKKGMN